MTEMTFQMPDLPKGLAKRHKAEKRFRLMALASVLLGLIFLVLVVFFYFYPYQKNHKNRNVVSLLVIISILFIEWFYNHPSLR